MGPDQTDTRDDRLARLAERVHAALQRTCVPDSRILIAVSGGADSVALAELVSRTRWTIAGIAFVDHGMRDVTLERQASLATAQRIGAPWHELTLSLKDGGNLQARARAARYRALLELARVEGAVLATGHTSTDQAETVLGRMLRGSGVRGLAGLTPRQGRVVRPLLGVSREETRALGFAFADDPSNVARRFTRNRLRAEILPVLARENPRVVESLSALADSARGTTALVSALLGELARLDRHLYDLDVGTDAMSALLHHLASESGASPTRDALALWTNAAVAKRPTRVSLGDGFYGVVGARGELSLEVAPDPRQVLTLSVPEETAPPGRAPRSCRIDGLELQVRVDECPGPDALRLDGPGPWTLVPLPGARAAQRGLEDLDEPVLSLTDATGRTLGRARADGSWMPDRQTIRGTPQVGRSHPQGGTDTANALLYATFETLSRGSKSEVVAPPEGPLTSPDAHDGASPQMGGTEGLPNRGCAPTETKSSSRIDGREG